MIEVSTCANEADEVLGLDVYNAVWPHDRVALAEDRAFRASMRDHADLLARIDGAVAGSALAAILPVRPDRAFVLVTVLPEFRGRGVGTASDRWVGGSRRLRARLVAQAREMTVANKPQRTILTLRTDARSCHDECMSDELVSVLWTSSLVEAEIARGRLEAESIPVQLQGEGADAPYPVGPVELLVPSRLEEEARRILAQDEDSSDRS